MKNYAQYDIMDFVLDDDFIRWVNEKRLADEAFWHDWLDKHPEKNLVVAEAGFIIQAIQVNEIQTGNNNKKEAIDTVLAAIRKRKNSSYRMLIAKKWWWAAAILIVAATGIGLLLKNNDGHQNQAHVFSYTSMVSSKRLIEKTNISDTVTTLVLPDGSVAELSPQSRLAYGSSLQDSATRDVYLSGEAFFKVTKNAQKPFRVFANEVVAKVLGTSFTVRAFDGDKSIRIMVRTGKVGVYAQTSTQPGRPPAVFSGDVLLKPNQQAVYLKDEQRFQKTILEKPVIIDPTITKASMVYDDVPVAKVLEQLKKAYGISIVYDADALANCTITADLTEELLYKKLDLICKTIGAKYEVVDSEIFIEARGCK